jgi:hypothetical protein
VAVQELQENWAVGAFRVPNRHQNPQKRTFALVLNSLFLDRLNGEILVDDYAIVASFKWVILEHFQTNHVQKPQIAFAENVEHFDHRIDDSRKFLIGKLIAVFNVKKIGCQKVEKFV